MVETELERIRDRVHGPERRRELEETPFESDVGEWVYRGQPLYQLQDEFRQKEIPARAYNVHRIVGGETDRIGPGEGIGLTDVEDLPFELETETVAVAGGMTDVLGTAVHFSLLEAISGEIPGVMMLEVDRIVSDVFEVEYVLEWFDEHPGALARVETNAVGEIRWNDKIYGLTAMGPDEFVNNWGRERMRTRASSNIYESEAETLGFGAPVDLDASLATVVSYYSLRKGGPNNPHDILKGQEGYTVNSHEARSKDWENVEFWDQEESLMELHEIGREMVPEDVPYISVVVSSYSKEKTSFAQESGPGGKFEFAYDGDRIIEDEDEIPEPVLGRVR